MTPAARLAVLESLPLTADKRAAVLVQVEQRNGVTKSVGSNARTSAAICVRNAAGSDDVMRAIADTPRTSADQKVSLPMPFGAIAPRPVITTRRAAHQT